MRYYTRQHIHRNSIAIIPALGETTFSQLVKMTIIFYAVCGRNNEEVLNLKHPVIELNP